MFLQVYKWIIQMRIYSGLLLENWETKSQEWQIRSDRKQKNGAVQRADTVQLSKWVKVKWIIWLLFNNLSMLDLQATIHIRNKEVKGQDWLLSWPGIGCNYTNLDTKSIFLHSRPFKRYYIFRKKIISVKKKILICYL